MSLHIHPLTSWHRAVFLLNSRTGLFIAAARGFRSESLHLERHPFFRSYGANLPSSLTLVSLAHLRLLASPTCVGLRYGQPAINALELFPSAESQRILRTGVQIPYDSQALACPTVFDQHFRSLARLTFCVPLLLQPVGTGILTCPPSTTPFGLALGSD